VRPAAELLRAAERFGDALLLALRPEDRDADPGFFEEDADLGRAVARRDVLFDLPLERDLDLVVDRNDLDLPAALRAMRCSFREVLRSLRVTRARGNGPAVKSGVVEVATRQTWG
jgi:hypothetical protein